MTDLAERLMGGEMMSDQLRVRPFTIADASQVVDLLQDVSRFQLSPDQAQNSAQAFVMQNGVYAFVALEDCKVIGFGALFAYGRVRGGRVAVIEDMVIAENFRGRGVGRLILDELIKSAQEEGCFKVSLESSNIAQSFYQAAGFECGGQTMKRVLSIYKQ